MEPPSKQPMSPDMSPPTPCRLLLNKEFSFTFLNSCAELNRSKWSKFVWFIKDDEHDNPDDVFVLPVDTGIWVATGTGDIFYFFFLVNWLVLFVCLKVWGLIFDLKKKKTRNATLTFSFNFFSVMYVVGENNEKKKNEKNSILFLIIDLNQKRKFFLLFLLNEKFINLTKNKKKYWPFHLVWVLEIMQ